MSNIVTGLRETERQKLVKRACNSLFWFATKKLGYDLLTVKFHKPMLDKMDEFDRLAAQGKRQKEELIMWPRDHYKTTVMRARIIREIIRNPFVSVIWWHAVEEIAQESGLAVGQIIQTNKEVREMLPERHRPNPRALKFATAKGFRLPGTDPKQPKTMRMWGATGEATGGKCIIGVMDDVIGHNDIEDNLMPKKRRWMANTVENVVRTDVGRKFWIGTHWDADDIWSDLRKRKKDVHATVRGCYETDGKPDLEGEPVLYTREELEAKRRKMTAYQFSCQLMNDPLPESDRLWNRDLCENFITASKAADGEGRLFLLSDPAPRQVGSLSQVKEKERGDSSKDWWSICVIRIRVMGMVQQIILLDGISSQTWTTDDGLGEACKMMTRWGTTIYIPEHYGGLSADQSDRMLEIAPQHGVKVYLDPKTCLLPRFSDSHASGAKNIRMEALCDRARRKEFLICDTVPDDFLYGDNEHTGFLTQIRRFRTLPSGRNVLRWDDDVDVVARSTDSKLSEFAPRPALGGWDPMAFEEEEEWVPMSRYCGA